MIALFKTATSVLVLALSVSASAATCPSKAQKIMVIDLKSGWWQGDGADTDQYVIKHITSLCPSVTFTYEHTLYGGFGPMPHTPIGNAKDFDQIWLLSGGEADGQDIRINSPEFKRYLELITQGKGNVFLGTGFGNVYHANAVTAALGLGRVALTDRDVHEYPSPTGGVKMVSELLSDLLDSKHQLFLGLTSLPDIVNVGGFVAPSDWLATDIGIRPLATSDDGKTVIGEIRFGERRLIIDANLARTYLIRNADENIKRYLVNLVLALEH